MIAVDIKRKYAFVRAASDISENRFFRSLPDAQWMKREKCWRIPRETISHILLLEQENKMEVQWSCGEEEVESLKSAMSQLYEDATQAYRENPFEVPDAFMNLIPVKGWFYWDTELDRLLVRISADSSFRSILRQFGGGRWIHERRSFTVDSSSIRQLLKKLKKKECSFAVAYSAAQRLQQMNSFRERLHSLSSEDMIQSPLRPALIYHKDAFHLLGSDLALREKLLPDSESDIERKKETEALSFSMLVKILFRMAARKEPLWLDSEVLKALQDRFKTDVHFYAYDWGTVLCVSKNESDLHALVTRHSPEISSLSIGSETLYMTVLGDELADILGEHPKENDFLPTCYQYDETAKARLEAIMKRAEARELNARMAIATYSVPDSILEHDQALREKLYPHQRTAVEWFLTTEHGLLGDDMGLGKTISVLSMFSELRWRGDIEKMIIVCPNSLVKNWLKEAKAWLPKLRFESSPKGASFRRSFFRKLQSYDYCDVVVVNFESFRSPQVLAPLMEWVDSHATFLCIDESQRAKNPQSKSFEALQKMAPLARRRILLSGTPAPKDITDLWTQVFLIDLGERFGRDFFRWLENIAVLGNKFSKIGVVEFKEREVERIKLRVREILLRRRKEDVIDLPEKVFSTRYVEMHGSQKRRYDEVCKTLKVRMTSMSGKAFYRDIDNTLEEFLRAVQIASNPRLVDETFMGESAKFIELDQLLYELIEEQDEKVVVWTNYLVNVRELRVRYKKYGAFAFSGEQSVDERAHAVEEFQKRDSGFRVLIAVPAAGGVGITLTAARTAIYLDKTWNGEHWLQSIDRVHRIGQEGVVNIVSLESGRVDGLISSNLEKKEMFLRDLLDSELSTDQYYPTREELLAALEESQAQRGETV